MQHGRTTVAVRVSTRDRITANSTSESTTVDAFLNKLLDEHESKKFWEQMDATDAGEYERACREDGTWPGDWDYAPEADRA
jgi:hypothetical protein